MKNIYCIALLLLTLLGCELTTRQSPSTISENYLISKVNVIDVINEITLSDHFVLVEEGIITSVTKTRPIDLPESLLIIDGQGKYLIPGLWDAHSVLTQLSPELDYPLYIANGVTSIRSILNCPNKDEISLYPCMRTKTQWNKSVIEQKLIGPMIEGSGTFPINGTASIHPDVPEFHTSASSDKAKQLASYYASYPESDRPFFLKNYNWLEPEHYLALAKHARENGLYLGGHMPRKVGLIPAIEAGQRSFAHARLFMFDCSAIAGELRAGMHWDKALPDFYQFLLSSYDEQMCKIRFEKLKDNNVFLSPTILTRRNDYLAVSDLRNDVKGLDYVHYMMSREWDEDVSNLKKHIKTAKDVEMFKQFYKKSAKTIGDAAANGVKVMAGTDSYDIFVVPGFSLHEELIELTKAGLTNYQAIAAATINPALYFKLDHKLGAIKPNYEANLVLLNKNPVESIENTQSISHVFQRQNIYDNISIDKMKMEVKKLAGSHAVTAELIALFARNPSGF